LKRAIDLSPDQWAFVTLAGVYKAQGRIDRWKETLDAFLEQEDYGLDHAKVRVEIAQYYMGRQEWEQARPYAEEAAQTWAAWAMECAIACYQGMGDWERAELWCRRRSERYPNLAAQWFGWCLRTGHGDARAAARLAAPVFEAQGDRISVDDLGLYAMCSILLKEPTRALGQLRKSFPTPDHALGGLYLALLADEAGDARLRDQTWDHIGTAEVPIVRLAALFRAATAEGGKGELDRAAVDAVLEAAAEPRRQDLAYFVGRFLELRGRTDDAIAYLTRCTSSAQTRPWIRVLAASALRDLDPGACKVVPV
jgi:hypothetical protein